MKTCVIIGTEITANFGEDANDPALHDDGNIILGDGGLIENKMLTRDQVRNLALDNVVADDAKGFADLGIAPKTMARLLMLSPAVVSGVRPWRTQSMKSAICRKRFK